MEHRTSILALPRRRLLAVSTGGSYLPLALIAGAKDQDTTSLNLNLSGNRYPSSSKHNRIHTGTNYIEMCEEHLSEGKLSNPALYLSSYTRLLLLSVLSHSCSISEPTKHGWKLMLFEWPSIGQTSMHALRSKQIYFDLHQLSFLVQTAIKETASKMADDESTYVLAECSC